MLFFPRATEAEMVLPSKVKTILRMSRGNDERVFPFILDSLNCVHFDVRKKTLESLQ